MNTDVERIVDQSSAVSAGLAIVLSPFPLVDEAVMLPLLGAMSVRIGYVHGVGWKELPWKALTTTAVGGLLARATVNLGVSYIPFVAAAANAASAAALTGAFGAYADRVCAHPADAHAETLDELRIDVRELTARWRRLCTNLAGFVRSRGDAKREPARPSRDPVGAPAEVVR